MSIDQATNFSTPARQFGARGRPAIARVALYLGALAVLATGIAHVQQFYADDYSSVPTIGTLFYLNFLSAVLIAAGLVAPLGRIAGRYAGTIRAAFAVAGIGLGAVSLVALFVSESSGLFGFQEHGYRTPIALAIVFEVAAIVFLAVFLAANGTGTQNLHMRSRHEASSTAGGAADGSLHRGR
jgi:hypothetical protein